MKTNVYIVMHMCGRGDTLSYESGFPSAVGDSVREDEVVCEIETDKV